MEVKDHKERGILVANSKDYIQKHRPGLVVLENVSGILAAKHLPLVAWIVQTLNKLGYQATQRLLNTRDFGVAYFI
jgi:site-specific DNA-cytosine methylase